MKFFIFSLIFIFSYTESNAQPIRKFPRLGIKGGLNYSHFNAPDLLNKRTLSGLHAGILYNIPLNRYFDFQPEAIFNQRGAKFNLDNVFDEVSLRLNYIDIPLLGVLKLKEYINIQAGPYVGLLIGDPAGQLLGVLDPNINFNKSHFHTFDYGICGGIGGYIRPIRYGIRYYIGFSEIGLNELADFVLQDTRNSLLQFYIGF